MPGNDVNILLGPNMAARIKRAVEFIERNPRYNTTPPAGMPNVNIPIPKIGKAHDNIAPRTFGAVDCWEGIPGSETASTFITTTIQEFNLLDRTITAGKFVWMFGQYIFGAVFPALEIDATLTASLAPGGTATATVNGFSNGDNPGGSVTVSASQMQGTTTIASGKPVYCTWDDRNQFYRVRGWGC